MDNKNNVSHDQQPPLPPPSLETEKEDVHQVPCYLLDEMVNVPDIKNNPFPITRVKRIMGSDPDVVIVSVDAPVLLAKACEMFLADLTNRAWLNARENKHNMIRKPDVINALATHEACDFLLDLFLNSPREAQGGADEAGPSGTTNVGGN